MGGVSGLQTLSILCLDCGRHFTGWEAYGAHRQECEPKQDREFDSVGRPLAPECAACHKRHRGRCLESLG